ncbi:MAG: dolichol kinase [Candidatus Brockarchaeota archaeon]|nr:dolichol kinase [Candidatus Brockarchaeota archaeon]
MFETIVIEGFYAGALFLWVLFVVGILTYFCYKAMIKRLPDNVAVYYNRKIIHILAGGVIGYLVPLIFSTPLYPLTLSMVLGAFTLIPHLINKIMYWFQTKDNIYEVHFCFSWGLILTAGWFLTGGNFWFGAIPILFMALGDAATGLVRNTVFRKRTKSWWGNLAMAVVNTIIGLKLALPGVVAGLFSSVIEHFEFGPIDDNITVPVSSFLILTIFYTVTPEAFSILNFY